jgi:hypothetical protein
LLQAVWIFFKTKCDNIAKDYQKIPWWDLCDHMQQVDYSCHSNSSMMKSWKCFDTCKDLLYCMQSLFCLLQNVAKMFITCIVGSWWQ